MDDDFPPGHIPEVMRCKKCFYFAGYVTRVEAGIEFGICLRYPPAMNAETRMPEYKVTRLDMYCGEWKVISGV